MQQATRTVPIVFANVTDPVGAGFVESLARPGGNATGFTHFEYGMSGKWLELLKEIAPRRDARRGPAGSRQSRRRSASSAQSRPWRRRSGWSCEPIDVRDAAEIERAIAAFAREPNGGLIVTAERVGDHVIAI